MAQNLAEALALYDRLGFCVIPIGPDKRPAFGSLVDGWLPYQKRRSTLAEHQLWWPHAGLVQNIGVVTGQVSGGLVAIDCDDLATYHRICQAMPELRHSLTARTSQGMHIYCVALEPVATTKFTLHGKTHHVKAEGGYVVAPPSRHESGHVYAFANPVAVPVVIQPADLQAALLHIGAVKSEPQARPAGEPGWVAAAIASPPAQGDRDETLIKLASYFNGRLPWDVTEEILVEVAARMSPPLSRGYVQGKIKSASRYDRKLCPECGRVMPTSA